MTTLLLAASVAGILAALFAWPRLIARALTAYAAALDTFREAWYAPAGTRRPKPTPSPIDRAEADVIAALVGLGTTEKKARQAIATARSLGPVPIGDTGQTFDTLFREAARLLRRPA